MKDSSNLTLDDLGTEYRGMFLRIAYAYLWTWEDAEDCVQEALMNAWLSWDRRKDPEKTIQWMTSIVIRECLEIMRRKRCRPQNLGIKMEVADLIHNSDSRKWLDLWIDTKKEFYRMRRDYREVIQVSLMKELPNKSGIRCVRSRARQELRDRVEGR